VRGCGIRPRGNHDAIASRLSSGLVGLLLACGAYACSEGGSAQPNAAPHKRPPVPVSVEAVKTMPVPLEIAVNGNVVPISTIAVRSRIDGQIMRVFFREGQDVKQGAPLFQIDPRTFKAALQRASADLARDEAQLRNAELEQKRYTSLLEQKLVSQQELDQRATAVETLRATVLGDHGALDNARLNLGATDINAEVAGRTGGLQITAGNVVKANADPPLVTIRQISPIYVAFAVPADRLSEIRRFQSQGALAVEARVHGDAAALPASGQLTFIDNTIDVATGTIALKATFKNADQALWPGQFVDVVLRLTAMPNATVIPSRAIQTGQRGEQVFVVGDKLTAEVRLVKTSTRIGEWVMVEQGVSPGERVVVDGQLNLVADSKVAIKAAPAVDGTAPALRGGASGTATQAAGGARVAAGAPP
jgi:multidrug efflux system membrane fusion protein